MQNLNDPIEKMMCPRNDDCYSIFQLKLSDQIRVLRNFLLLLSYTSVVNSYWIFSNWTNGIKRINVIDNSNLDKILS